MHRELRFRDFFLCWPSSLRLSDMLWRDTPGTQIIDSEQTLKNTKSFFSDSRKTFQSAMKRFELDQGLTQFIVVCALSLSAFIMIGQAHTILYLPNHYSLCPRRRRLARLRFFCCWCCCDRTEKIARQRKKQNTNLIPQNSQRVSRVIRVALMAKRKNENNTQSEPEEMKKKFGLDSRPHSVHRSSSGILSHFVYHSRTRPEHNTTLEKHSLTSTTNRVSFCSLLLVYSLVFPF